MTDPEYASTAELLLRKFREDSDYDTADPLAETFTDVLSGWLPTPFDR